MGMQSMGDYLRETGRQLVLDPECTKDPVEFVERLLAEKDKYDRWALHGRAGFDNVDPASL